MYSYICRVITVTNFLLTHLATAQHPLAFRSVHKIFHIVSESPEKYTIQVHSTDLFLHINVPRHLYDSCFPCAFIFYHPTTTALIEPFQTRYTQLNNIIIMHDSLVVSKYDVASSEKFANLTSTTYLFMTTNYQVTLTSNNPQILYPAIKILVTKLPIMEFCQIICHGYCRENIITDELPTEIIRDPVRFHKATFWNGNGRLVSALGIGYDSYLNYFSQEDRYICSYLVGTAILSGIAWMCEESLMSVLTLAEVHNISFLLLNTQGSAEDMFTFRAADQFLLKHDLTFKTLSGNSYGKVIAGSAHYNLIYCQQNNPGSNYQLWLHAFPYNVWILFMLSCFAGLLYFKISSIKMFDLFGLILGQEVGRVTGRVVHTLIFAYFMRNFFENTLTSVVLVPPATKLFTSLGEMVQHNIKIVYHPRMFEFDPANLFMSDFRRNGVANVANETFVKLPENWDLGYVADEFLNPRKGVRYSLIDQANTVVTKTYMLEMNVKEKSNCKDPSCHRLKQRLNPTFSYFALVMVNRNWVIISLQRMRDGGFVGKWYEWSQSLQNMIIKTAFRAIEQKFSKTSIQVVDMEHITPVCYLCAGIYCFAIVVHICNLLFTAEF